MFDAVRPRRLRRYCRPSDWRVSAPNPVQWCALGLLTAYALAAMAPALFASQDPLAIGRGAPRSAPSWEHLFGTDEFGRDVFARVVGAAPSSVLVGVASPLLALLLGTLLGSLAAMLGKYARAGVERVIELLVAFPAIILAVVLASVVGPGLGTTILVLAVIYTPAMARVVRANVSAQLGADYVTAARAAGASRIRLLTRHVGRNACAPIVVFATTLVADAIFMEAALSFIGVGIQPPAPSWGNIINDGRTLVSSGGWWVTTFAGLAVFACVLAINVTSEWLADSLDAPSRSGPGDEPVDRAERQAARSWPRVPIEPRLLTGRPEPPEGAPLLSVRDLCIAFPDAHGKVDVVSGMCLDIRPGEVVGLVGESGSGKSITGLAITGLLPAGARTSGSVVFRGREILGLRPADRRRLLGTDIAIVYQDALSSLNPAMTVRQQLRQVCRRGSRYTPEQLLELVELVPSAVLRARPGELSGGQRQRVLLALALARDPALLIADEPTTALDETVQAQVLNTLERLREELGLAILLVSHDLALVASMAHRVVVLYAGQPAESGTTRQVLTDPLHPYTNGLLASVVSLERRDERLAQIDGTVPTQSQFGDGCRFAPRCNSASDQCVTKAPAVGEHGRGHDYACWHPMLEEAL